MKMTVKKMGAVSVLLTSIALAACSGSNPLQSQSKADSLVFVEKASKVIEQSLHYTAYPPGSMYRDCMSGTAMSDPVIKKNPELCEKLYEGMASYAKATDGPFKNITASELKDQKAFRPLYNIPLDRQ